MEILFIYFKPVHPVTVSIVKVPLHAGTQPVNTCAVGGLFLRVVFKIPFHRCPFNMRDPKDRGVQDATSQQHCHASANTAMKAHCRFHKTIKVQRL